MRNRFGFPGTVVLQFVFGEGLKHPQRLTGDGNCVVYTGTHDNPTAVQWWQDATALERANVARALDANGIDGEVEPHWMLVRLALASRARVAIVPAQDLLGLGAGARMNRPGKASGNWRWRLGPGQLTKELARRLRGHCEAAGRV